MSQPACSCAYCGAKFRGDWALCVKCADGMAANLLKLFRREVGKDGRPLPNLLDDLLITVTRQSRLIDPLGGRAGAETPLVFHALAADRLRALSAFLRDSYRHYLRTLRGQHLKRDTPFGHAAWLHAHASQIAKLQDSGEFAATLERLSAEATEAVDRPADLWFAGPCPTCEADLYATEGAGTVRCRHCRNTVDVGAQRERLLSAVDDVLATAGEISRAVHLTGMAVTPSRITNLYHRGKLVRHGRNRTGDHLYRLGDVMYVLESQRR